TNVPTRPPPVYSYMDRFSSKFFQKIVATKGGGNLAYSPVSVHSLLGLIYGASVGKTASELQRAGEFVEEALNVAMDFERLIRHKEHLQGAELTMVSKMYYNQQLGGVNPSYIPFAETYYDAGIEAVDMSRGNDAAAKINAWVADSTRNKIRSLVKPNDIDTQTQTVLVNAIYFKGRWENEFATMDTLPSKFQHSDGSSSSVAMMYNDDVFAMADLPELGATALELAYRDSATSMLLLLPKQVGGLHALEQQLARPEFDLNRIAARLRRQTVTVRLPRFRIEFEQDMTEPLKQLGVRQMFAPNSQVIKMLNAPVRVEKILQKAYVDVGEAGTEASAASCNFPIGIYLRNNNNLSFTVDAKFVPLSLPVKSPEFTADHPFVFAIRTPNSVLFMGHVEY
ncbi:hypothetical protein KR009_011700, partial [Drosophila setifemur]